MITVRSVDQEARFGSIWAGSPAMFARSAVCAAGFVVVVVVVLEGLVVFVVVVVLVAVPQDDVIIMPAMTRRLKNTISTFLSITSPFLTYFSR